MTPNTKGLFHVTVALAGVVEYFTAQTKTRKILLGICTAYHVQAAYKHFVKETHEESLSGRTNKRAYVRRGAGVEKQVRARHRSTN